MNIEKLIVEEAPKDTLHDRAYTRELKRAYENYKNLPLGELNLLWTLARKQYDSAHEKVANCIVLHGLVRAKEKKTITLLEEARNVLVNYRLSSNTGYIFSGDGECDDEDVLKICEKIDKFLEEEETPYEH